MKDIRIFVASSCEMVAERNALAYFAIAHEDEFAGRGLRVRLSKWEYVDPTMATGPKEDEYLKELRDSDGALILFQKVLGKFTRQEYDEALEYEKTGCRLQAHQILFKEGPDIAPSSDLAAWRAELPADAYRCFSDMAGLEAEFLALVNRLAGMRLCDAPSDAHVQRVTAFLVADDELAADRDAFADAILNFNDILAYRNLRVKMQFCSPGLGTAECHQIAAASEMMLVLYGRKVGVFGRDEIQRVYKRTCENANPKRLYVFFRTEDEKELPPEFRAFRDSFVEDLGHFVCQYGVSDTLRLNFVMSLERYVGEQCEQQKKEIFSTVETPTATKFVGREKELVRLHQLLKILPEFPTGRLPVVLGPGGSGKSELIRAYASQFRFKYPGGVFQVDMEKVSDWDGAFRGLLDRTSNTGVRVADYLGLGKDDARGEEGAEDRGLRTYSAAQIREALLKTARQKGPVLVVLDNVEDCRTLLGDDGRFCKAFPVGVSERVQVNVVATARVCDIPQNGDGWAVELPLEDLSPEAARELILSVRKSDDKHKADDKQEIAAVDEIARLLGYRALFLRRILALLVDDESDKACETYSELCSELKKSLLDMVSASFETLWQDDGKHLPDALWKLTSKRLSTRMVNGEEKKNEFGVKCVKLAQVASFFSPDGFPQHILKHLWKTLVAPEYEAKFDRALRLLQRHNIFQSTDPVRIHRLDRAAILQTAKAVSGLEDALGASLADYGLLSRDVSRSLYEHERIRTHLPAVFDQDREFWTKLLSVQPQFADRCPWEILDGDDWMQLLSAQPQFADRCPWEKFDGGGWTVLLSERPQFADRCPWEKLDGRNWAKLLCGQPQFADRCPWEKMEGGYWWWLLCAQPQFADRCPWEKLNGLAWVELLCVQPQFADRCSWEKLSSLNWVKLLSSQPQFADRCPWEKLDGEEWARLLSSQPQFADRCPWEKLGDWDWARVLSKQPQFADRCPWEKLDGGDWAVLLSEQPQFADRCPWKELDELGVMSWAELLREQPQFADRCPWGKFDGGDWRWLLSAQPQIADRCPWEKLDGWDWVGLLSEQSQFEDRCPWEKLDGRDWDELLSEQPQFADRCPWEKLDELYVCDWVVLLRGQPQFADRCPWEKFDGRDWRWLLSESPQFADRCPWKKLDGEDWLMLLSERPQFADRCDFNVFKDYPSQLQALLEEHSEWRSRLDVQEVMNGYDWAELLSEQPQFADHCPWEKLDGSDWVSLLSKRPQFADRCSWEKLGGWAWVELLSIQPQFADRCPWVELDGWGWASLLSKRPQFADRCSWEKLGGLDWVKLLSMQPQFADRCPWEELDGWNWAELLSIQPQFAGHCSWKKLDEKDWSRLLAFQPQLAKWRVSKDGVDEKGAEKFNLTWDDAHIKGLIAEVVEETFAAAKRLETHKPENSGGFGELQE